MVDLTPASKTRYHNSPYFNAHPPKRLIATDELQWGGFSRCRQYEHPPSLLAFGGINLALQEGMYCYYAVSMIVIVLHS